MKKNSLAYKLILGFILILTATTLLVAGVLSVWFKQYYFSQKRSELDKQSLVIENAAISYLMLDKNSNLTTLKNVIEFVGDSENTDIFLTDNMGYVYAVSNDKYSKYTYSHLGITQEQMKLLKKGESISYDKKDDIYGKGYVFIKPIFNGKYFSGAIVMATSVESINKEILRVNEVIWITAILAILIGSFIIYSYCKKKLTGPLNNITRAARKLASGDVDARIQIDSNNDEIGELADSFNIMAESLSEIDSNRRTFISNVSHELRSPITSIKGFISGILDGVIPKDKEGYYLNIVYDETDRLSRLINDLLDLSAMETGKIKLNSQEIDINALIKRCLDRFEGIIEQKGVHVNVTLENAHEYVIGDLDRITQVITNLLDNALKYGYENGEIKIKTKTKQDKVYVSIFNEGPTLSQEQKIKIWDRFYKADESRTNKVSTGLGLPIVRLILTEHNEDIWVENIKDKGVEFTFTLSKIK